MSAPITPLNAIKVQDGVWIETEKIKNFLYDKEEESVVVQTNDGDFITVSPKYQELAVALWKDLKK